MDLCKYLYQSMSLLLVLLMLASGSAHAAEKLVIYTVNYPLQYFAERIGGRHVEVHFPAPADVDPAFWIPDAETIGQYQKADLILLNGANYAKWIKKASLPRMRMVNTSREFADQYISIEQSMTHSHGPGGEHSHAGMAFTTWLDFRQASLQAKAIMRALVRLRPEHEKEFAKNTESLQQELITLENELVAIIAKNPNKALLASHPVYQYLARRYELNLKSYMWEPDVYPKPGEWQSFSVELQASPAKWMLWEAQPIVTISQQLASMGVSVVVYEPCMNKPGQGDFMSVMKQNIKNLAVAFE